MPRKALGWRDGGRRGPGHSRAQRGRVCPNLLSCSQLASLSSQQMWEKRGPSHQQDPRDQRSQRRRGIPLLRVGPKKRTRSLSREYFTSKSKKILHKEDEDYSNANLTYYL